ncbi:helix-turn-helix domain-containing protein [Arcobacter ellisii]|jgi:predicted site-specific integrase-resolvase|uniref:DNA-binding protein n=1 Tax=Arcobacter ellisii TaxID=913109 RepID=A0A347UA54_9BACT|nr:helix-turn-helix domain-containing protein [Arcobacter ellisii]AXX95732.1 putative transcriptional regulator [Arcobacter ellisii]RXI31396.1 DNA-binding protein [Arcobacter ellisii]
MSTNVEKLYQKYKKSLLKKKEAAEELNISVATLDRLRNQGLIKSKKIRGGVFFTITEIASFIGE